ncbi:proline-rich small protein YnaL [Buttiauxella sp. WJP83]
MTVYRHLMMSDPFPSEPAPVPDPIPRPQPLPEPLDPDPKPIIDPPPFR